LPVQANRPFQEPDGTSGALDGTGEGSSQIDTASQIGIIGCGTTRRSLAYPTAHVAWNQKAGAFSQKERQLARDP